ncbi:MAG: cation transporter [Firmicutes bacterium]|nr:cation transporter [Bacillota bacterium]
MNRYESTRKVGIFGIIGNVFLVIIKFSVSLVSHSQALLADAINSAGDIFSSIMTAIGNKIASTPHDEDHNFGHGKAEYIFSLIISIFMLFIASKILIDSIISIITKKVFIFSYFLVIVCMLTIITKFILYIYCKKVYKSHQNILVKASMKDHRNDMLLTFGTLISVLLGNYGLYFFDGIFGSIISLYIMYSGIGIFLESYKILMDVSLVKAEKENIISYILKNKQIKSVNDFNTVAIGYKYIAILTIDVDGNLNTFDSHVIADNLEKSIPKEFKKISKVIVHVNPIKIDKE